MRPVRITATILFHLTRIAALLFLLTGVYAFLVKLLASYLPLNSGIPFSAKPDGSFIIYYPFTRSPFLLGDNTISWFIISMGIVILYGIFLLLLSGVFKAFRQERLFTPENVGRLKRFYLFNLIVPAVCILCMAISGEEIRDALVIVFLHLMIGVFAFFMAAIFKQGLVLQEEQDLTL